MTSERPHTIRLRGPWSYEPLAHTRLLPDGSTRAEPGSLPAPGRIQLPADWSQTLGSGFRGRVRYTRHFNRPTGLEPGDRVELVVTQLDAFGSAELNGHVVMQIPGGVTGHRVDITGWLRPHNELRIEVELPRVDAASPALPRPAGRENQAGGLIDEVRLEIWSAHARESGPPATTQSDPTSETHSEE